MSLSIFDGLAFVDVVGYFEYSLDLINTNDAANIVINILVLLFALIGFTRDFIGANNSNDGT